MQVYNNLRLRFLKEYHGTTNCQGAKIKVCTIFQETFGSGLLWLPKTTTKSIVREREREREREKYNLIEIK